MDDKRGQDTATRRAYWDRFATSLPRRWSGLRRYYLRRLSGLYRFLIPAGSRVLELGCGQGDLLSSLEPAYGVGLDVSAEMLSRGRARFPDLRFVEVDVQDLDLGEKFDNIVASDLAVKP
jgi:SAM-dependent methyltransferase